MITRRDAFWLSASLVPLVSRIETAAEPTAATPTPPKTLNDYFPFTPPKTKAEWAKRREELREQVLVSQGLWPMPEKTPLNPVVHGKIERDGYTIEKVYFASTPGHYVSGNLYRPTGTPAGQRAGVLSPHGHAANGRLHESTDARIASDFAIGAETDRDAARYYHQARCANLAMLGFVVFHYDMVGYADSTAIPHREGFKDAAAELRLQSFMGLQTWNSIRALDFLTGLPDVDPKRIGVTGASGGGTQTFMLCAVDDRPAAAFPAVMVSTAMQGGCVCENASYLRVDTGNVELAALFAPKPLAMSAADDWTKEIMTKGFPELKQLCKVLGDPGNVAAKAWLKFPHNYSQPSREFMYSWFSEHLLGKPGEVKEKPFVPVPPKELSVYDADHPRPADELSADKLREEMAAASDAQMAKLTPTDAESLAKFREVVGPALRVMVGDGLPAEVTIRSEIRAAISGTRTDFDLTIGRSGSEDVVPIAGNSAHTRGSKFDFTQPLDRAIVWVHPKGKASLDDGGPTAQRLLAAGLTVFAPDVLGTGDSPLPGFTVTAPQHGHVFAGYTYGYNRTLLANRVRDVLTTIAFIKSKMKAKDVSLVGWGEFGPVAVLASALAGDAVTRTAADIHKFRFDKITKLDDPMMLPGAVKYGGLGAFLALCSPQAVLAYNTAGTGIDTPAKAAYEAAGAKGKLELKPGEMSPEAVAKWLIG